MTKPLEAWHPHAHSELHALTKGDLLRGIATELFVELIKHEFMPGKEHMKTKTEADHLCDLFQQNEKLHKLGFPALDVVSNGKNTSLISRARTEGFGWSDEPWLDTENAFTF